MTLPVRRRYIKVPPIDTSNRLFIHNMQYSPKMEDQSVHSATAIAATPKSPAATEPMFFVAAPAKAEDDGDPAPVFVGATGAIGDPVAPAPDAAPVPVGIGAVPVMNPVVPATAVELDERISIAVIESLRRVRHLTLGLWSWCTSIQCRSMLRCIQSGKAPRLPMKMQLEDRMKSLMKRRNMLYDSRVSHDPDPIWRGCSVTYNHSQPAHKRS